MNTLTFEVGTKIRAYDFVSRTDCYIEGIVKSIDLTGSGKITADVTYAISIDQDYTDEITEFSTYLTLGDERLWEKFGRERIVAI